MIDQTEKEFLAQKKRTRGAFLVKQYYLALCRNMRQNDKTTEGSSF